MTTEKFLEFNGQKLTLVNSDGNFYIALKPICEVLNVDWESQRQAISRHPFLASTTCILQVVATNNKLREMVCLPEKYIYGWLLSFTPKTQEHINFQKECYDVLYSHFHNVLNGRIDKLQTKTQLKAKYQELHNQQLLTNPDYKRLLEIQQELKTINNNLNQFDNLLLSGQMEIGFE